MMTRPIKFRGWDGKEMYEIDLSYYIRCHEGSQEDMLPWEARDNGLMQFTGITDKNGKEIYEGDLVDGDWYGTFQVQFPFYKLYSAYYEGEKFEVIGNAYENPELLN